MNEDGDEIIKQTREWTENFSTIWKAGELTEEHVDNSRLAKFMRPVVGGYGNERQKLETFLGNCQIRPAVGSAQ
jgi:hypothetical protein